MRGSHGRRSFLFVWKVLVLLRARSEVIFAPQGSLFLLGATALENSGADVDPI